jgi:hypothetical protein
MGHKIVTRTRACVGRGTIPATGVPYPYCSLIRPNFTITPQTIIKTPVRYTFPDHIICSIYSEGGKSSRSFEVLYRGPGGYRHHLHTRCHYIATVQFSTPVSQPSSSQAASNVGRAPTQVQTRRAVQKEHARPKLSKLSVMHLSSADD